MRQFAATIVGNIDKFWFFALLYFDVARSIQKLSTSLCLSTAHQTNSVTPPPKLQNTGGLAWDTEGWSSSKLEVMKCDRLVLIKTIHATSCMICLEKDNNHPNWDLDE